MEEKPVRVELSAEEIGAMNNVKGLSQAVANALHAVRGMPNTDQRALKQARVHLEQGLTWLARSILQKVDFTR
jgi:hypothetical protein